MFFFIAVIYVKAANAANVFTAHVFRMLTLYEHAAINAHIKVGRLIFVLLGYGVIGGY